MSSMNPLRERSTAARMADVQADSVSQILRAGYRKGERVLRAAQVIVAVPE